MATVTAVRHNPAIRAFYTCLCEKGKPRKVALVAAMRKLLTVLNAVSHPVSDPCLTNNTISVFDVKILKVQRATPPVATKVSAPRAAPTPGTLGRAAPAASPRPTRSPWSAFQGNRKIAFTVKTGVTIWHRKAGRNLAHMEKVPSLS